MDVFVLVFAAVFIAGFVVRAIWRSQAPKCPHCGSLVKPGVLVCATCGRDMLLD